MVWPRAAVLVLCCASVSPANLPSAAKAVGGGSWRPGEVGCRDEHGKAVDWWFIYKLPDGFVYAYWDAASNGAREKLVPVNDRFLNCTTQCALGSTLHQLYLNKTGLASVLYNDEPPEPYGADAASDAGVRDGYQTAHAKGTLAFDGTGAAFWLIHSVPKFPDLTLPSFTWTASTTYGQSFLCLSLDAQTVDVAAFQLRHVNAQIFSANAPKWLPEMGPNMSLLINRTQARETNASIQTITTRAGVAVDHFAKSAVWGRDLYEDFVEDHYQQGFMWETWRRMPYTEPTYCSKDGNHRFDSVNVMSIAFGNASRYDQSFKYTRDHCKWGISQTGPIVCVGDINRMTSQKKRGGGTACMRNLPLWSALHGIINSTETCVIRPGT